MSETRDEKLATFQSITGIQDVNEAIVLLESVGWNLSAAIDADVVMINDDAEENVNQSNSSPPDSSVANDQELLSDYAPSEPDSDVSVGGSSIGPLIPENVEDELAGSLCFIDNFIIRYGQNVPSFLAGTLEDASKEAFSQPASMKRLLCIYLHHIGSILTNVFCTQLLCYDDVMKVLSENFVVWGWDVSCSNTKQMYLESSERNLGTSVKNAVKQLSIERYPVLLIVSRFRATVDIRTVIYGNVGLEELMTSLSVSVGEFKEHQELEVKEEESRAARQKLRAVQDQAYRESLEVDRAKAEAKRLKLLDEREKQEEEIRRKRMEEEDERLREEERLSAELSLPEEPGAFSQESVVVLKFRTPSGGVLQRKFLFSSSLELVFNFLCSKGFRIDEYRLISTWPRTDLSSLDKHTLLFDLGLSPQETLILEPR